MPAPEDVVSRAVSSDWRAEAGTSYARDAGADGQREGWSTEDLKSALPVRMPEGEGSSETLDTAYSHEATHGAADVARRTPTFETRRVADARALPYSAVGKLFMKFGSETASATAWVVGDRKLITAGHCLCDHRRAQPWPEAVAFVPAFDGSEASFGRQWAGTQIHVLAGWHERRPDMHRYDLGAVTLASSIAAATGRLDWAGGLAKSDEPYEAIGYPYYWISPTYAFDGRAMWRCSGDHAGGENPVRMKNNMTDGCSGGPWLVRRQGQLRVAGINSYRPIDAAEEVQSPLLGRGLENLLGAGGG